MRDAPDLRILFPTTYSDACRQTGEALEQLAGVCNLHLTMAHVVRPGARTREAHRALDEFLPQADSALVCRRILVEGDDAAGAIAEVSRESRFDLVMTPASSRTGMWGWLSRSFRARLMRRLDVPLWTAGWRLPTLNFRRPIRTVACLVDFDDAPERLLQHAAAFASRFDAAVHVLAVIPPIDDGTLAEILNSDAPLMPGSALSRIQAMFASRALAGVDVVVGERGHELERMIARCQPDLLFTGPRQFRRGGWLARVPRVFDSLPCPVVCLEGADRGFVGWSFQDSLALPVPTMGQAPTLAPAGGTAAYGFAPSYARWSSSRMPPSSSGRGL